MWGTKSELLLSVLDGFIPATAFGDWIKFQQNCILEQNLEEVELKLQQKYGQKVFILIYVVILFYKKTPNEQESHLWGHQQ